MKALGLVLLVVAFTACSSENVYTHLDKKSSGKASESKTVSHSDAEIEVKEDPLAETKSDSVPVPRLKPKSSQPKNAVNGTKQVLPFENKTCSSNIEFSELSESEKELCYEKISKLCIGVDKGRLTKWEPVSAPTEYLKYIDKSKTVQLRDNHFSCAIVSHAYKANAEVLKERKRLIALDENNMSLEEEAFFTKMFIKYKGAYEKVDKNGWFQPEKSLTKKQLLERIDIIPISLLIVIAHHESGWASNRFSKLANNVFSRYAASSCTKCIKALGSNNMLLIYDTLGEAVSDQVRYINRRREHREIGRYRNQVRQKSGYLRGRNLISKIGFYSEKGIGTYNGLIERDMNKLSVYETYDALDQQLYKRIIKQK